MSLWYGSGVLPVLYLGIPLITTRLTKVLISKLQSKILAWAANSLQMFGVSSIHVFWSSIFVLPKGVIKMLASLMAEFLSVGTDKVPYGANVAWKEICKPIIKEV